MMTKVDFAVKFSNLSLECSRIANIVEQYLQIIVTVSESFQKMLSYSSLPDYPKTLMLPPQCREAIHHCACFESCTKTHQSLAKYQGQKNPSYTHVCNTTLSKQ